MNHAAELQAEVLAALQRSVRGKVHADRLTCALYSTDASSYAVMPKAVVLPRDRADLQAIVEIAQRYHVPIVPRGGGTSLSGQAIGAGIIVDLSHSFGQIGEFDPSSCQIWVEAGCTLDRLNNFLKPHGLMFGPDPSSSASATIGGMLGNNSTGSHSIVYGMTVDHTLAMETILDDSSLAIWSTQVANNPRQQQIQAQLGQIVARYAPAIERDYPQVWRNVAGYNLQRMLQRQQQQQPFSAVPILVGSEGTLGLTVAAQLSLVARPKVTRLALWHFDDLQRALALVPEMLRFNPSAVELFDRYFINLTRQNPEYGSRLSFVVGEPRVVLIVEWAGTDSTELAANDAALEAHLRALGETGLIVRETMPAAIANVWAVRKAGLGLLMSQRGDAKPLAFVDDATVPVERLAEYARGVEAICCEAGTEATFYAHASVGCLHINPLINLKTEHGLAQMAQISQAVASLAISLGGTTTGEHGEGLARSAFNQQLYGAELHKAFGEIKQLFDPNQIFNPGKILAAPQPWQPEILRISPSYQTPHAPSVTFFDFTPDGGFAGLVEMCNGQGVCRKDDAGVMCPSYMATHDEANSTRGRANALRAAMTGQLGTAGLSSPELHEAMDLCLECKACKRECPSIVDMARLKSEWLAHYQATHGVPWRSRLFGQIAKINQLGMLVPRLNNWVLAQPITRWLLDRSLGIDQRRQLPALANSSFRTWFKRQSQTQTAPRGPLILWDDTFTLYNEPQIGQAAVKILSAAGYKVYLIEERRCCGRPLISKGMLAEARANAEHNIALLAPFAELGVPIIGLEPSCIASFRDEYPALVTTNAAKIVAAQSYFIEEFLVKLAAEGITWHWKEQLPADQVLVHGHCYQKALISTNPLLAMLRLVPNLAVHEIESGCCGMAGSFGYEREHYEVSLACGEQRLFPAVRSSQQPILAAGMSCRHQIEAGTGVIAQHPIVFLADCLAD